ncbi:MAG: ATP-binding protein [Rhizobacter sp.]|nr:ATP-binding protein [Ferruginibacter sp.]
MIRIIATMLMVFQVITFYGQGINRQQADSMLVQLEKKNAPIIRIDLLLNLAQFQIFKPGEDKIDFDSANNYIRQAAAINTALRSGEASGYQLMTEAFMTRERGQYGEAIRMMERAIPILEKGKNKLYLGRAYYELSQLLDYNKAEELTKMITLVEKSVTALGQAGDVSRKAFSLKMLGDLYNIAGNRPKSLATLTLAVEAYTSINYRELQGVYALLADGYRTENDYGQALRYALQALKIAEAVKDTTMQLCQINNILGTIYSNLGRDELTIKHYKDALKTALAYNDSATVAIFLGKIPNKYFGMFQPERALEFLDTVPEGYKRSENRQIKLYLAVAYLSAYFGKKQYDKAKPYCDQILKVADSMVLSIYDRYSVYGLATHYFIFAGPLSKAGIYLNKVKEITKEIRQPFIISTYHMLQYKLDSARGDYRSAFYEHLSFRKIKDSLFGVTKLRQFQQLEVEYGTEKKQDSIKLKDKDILLLTQANNLQQTNLEQVRLTKNITVAGILMAGIIILLLYRQYQQKQKSNVIITNKNEQLQHLLTEKDWLLKEIHHRVKNNFQSVMGLLGTQAAYLKNDVAKTAITDSRRRIQAMSLIHQKLYQTENLSAINMNDYVHELVDYLKDGFDIANHIRFNLQVEKIDLDLAHCVPLGLIINEALTNSFKHAFPGRVDATINISFLQTAEDHFSLSIHDNGTGLPSSLNILKPGSMGLNLMQGLSDEIGARFTIENKSGTLITVNFKYDPEPKAGISQTTSEVIHTL